MAIMILALTFVAPVLAHVDCEHHEDGPATAPSACVCACHGGAIVSDGLTGPSASTTDTFVSIQERVFLNRLSADDIYRPPISR